MESREDERLSLASIERELERFILGELLEEPDLSEGDPLTSGAVDSLGLEQLVEHVERTFGVVIADRDMVRDNFENISSLAVLVDSRQRGLGG